MGTVEPLDASERGDVWYADLDPVGVERIFFGFGVERFGGLVTPFWLFLCHDLRCVVRATHTPWARRRQARRCEC